ncbi:MAG: hypothetical protein HYY60_02225 [Parcubacteria group bacterium]|nr:hypothetical protein [Parcubacteria group bacterium]MBI3075269.1 hypothetical protein [Parcubacteria group bacterium]
MPNPLPSQPRIYKCFTCDWLCTKNVEVRPDGTVVHTICGSTVIDVTEEIEKYNTVPLGPCD